MPSKKATSNPQAPCKIVIIGYDGAKLMDIAGALQVFSDARYDNGRVAYQVILASEKGGLISSDTGVKLKTKRLDATVLDSVDTLLVSGADLEVSSTAPASLIARLARYLDRPRRLGAICTGAFVLAKLGALDGREVTTHWAFCAQLEREYPKVIVKPDAIFVISDRIWTSAGVSAGIDMALAMVETDLGHRAALKVARGMVLFLKRPGGQSQFSVELQRQIHDTRGRFDNLHDWVRANLAADLSVAALAEAARMSLRNFSRVYLRETGEHPARAIEKLRIEAAVRLLESADKSIQVIAHRVGFGDAERMRRAFMKTYGVSPQDYRSRFGRLQT